MVYFYNVLLVRLGPAAVSQCSVANATCTEFVWGLRVWGYGDCPNATGAKKDGVNCITVFQKEHATTTATATTTTTTHTHIDTPFGAYAPISVTITITISIAITFPIAIVFSIIAISTGIASG